MLMSPIIVAPALSRTPRPIRGARFGQHGPAANGDVLQDRGVVADHDERPHDDAGGMVEEHRGSDRRRGVNADLERIGGQALHQQCEIGTALPPEPVRHPPGLQGDVALEVQERRQQCRGRGIMNRNALQIAARRLDQIGSLRKRLTRNARETLRGRQRACRAARRFDGPPRCRGRNDRGWRPTTRRRTAGSRAKAVSASRRIERHTSPLDDILSGTMSIRPFSGITPAARACAEIYRRPVKAPVGVG